MSSLPDYILETTYQGTTKNATFNGHTLVIKEYRIPFVVPGGTITLQFSDSSYDPTSGTWAAGSRWNQVSSSPNVWEYTHTTSSWLEEFKNKFTSSSNLVSILGFNTFGITTLESAFEGCTALNSVDLFSLTRVQRIDNLFKGCTRLTTVPLLDLSDVEYAIGLFEGCTALTTVPLLDLSRAYNTSSMFKGCTALTTIPLINISHANNTSRMFEGCTALTSLPLLDLSRNNNMERMFYGCTSLTSLPAFDTSSVSNMDSMCMGCTALEEVPNYSFRTNTDLDNAFNGCINVEDGAYAFYAYANNRSITHHTDTFTNCGSNTVTGQADLDRIPTEWGGNYVVPRDIWFDGRAQIPRDMITSDIPFTGNWRLHGSTTGTVTPRAGDTVHVWLGMSDMPEQWYAPYFPVMFGSNEVNVSRVSGTNNWEALTSFTISSAIGTPYVKQNYNVNFSTSGYLYSSDSPI